MGKIVLYGACGLAFIWLLIHAVKVVLYVGFIYLIYKGCCSIVSPSKK